MGRPQLLREQNVRYDYGSVRFGNIFIEGAESNPSWIDIWIVEEEGPIGEEPLMSLKGRHCYLLRDYFGVRTSIPYTQVTHDLILEGKVVDCYKIAGGVWVIRKKDIWTGEETKVRIPASVVPKVQCFLETVFQ